MSGTNNDEDNFPKGRSTRKAHSPTTTMDRSSQCQTIRKF